MDSSLLPSPSSPDIHRIVEGERRPTPAGGDGAYRRSLYRGFLGSNVLRGHCDDVFEYFLPEKWVPHVTVAMEDLTDENLERVKKDLGKYHLYYRQVLSNIHLVQRCEDTRRIEIVGGYFLG
jgi:hypothetical protein